MDQLDIVVYLHVAPRIEESLDQNRSQNSYNGARKVSVEILKFEYAISLSALVAPQHSSVKWIADN